MEPQNSEAKRKLLLNIRAKTGSSGKFESGARFMADLGA
jgi:hypothetical protein